MACRTTCHIGRRLGDDSPSRTSSRLTAITSQSVVLNATLSIGRRGAVAAFWFIALRSGIPGNAEPLKGLSLIERRVYPPVVPQATLQLVPIVPHHEKNSTGFNVHAEKECRRRTLTSVLAHLMYAVILAALPIHDDSALVRPKHVGHFLILEPFASELSTDRGTGRINTASSARCVRTQGVWWFCHFGDLIHRTTRFAVSTTFPCSQSYRHVRILSSLP